MFLGSQGQSHLSSVWPEWAACLADPHSLSQSWHTLLLALYPLEPVCLEVTRADYWPNNYVNNGMETDML